MRMRVKDERLAGGMLASFCLLYHCYCALLWVVDGFRKDRLEMRLIDVVVAIYLLCFLVLFGSISSATLDVAASALGFLRG